MFPALFFVENGGFLRTVALPSDSPRLYVSTNPWKITATFKSISTTKEDYLKVIEDLKLSAPSSKEGEKKSKIELAHLALISTLESRLEAIDAEIAVSSFVLEIKYCLIFFGSLLMDHL